MALSVCAVFCYIVTKRNCQKNGRTWTRNWLLGRTWTRNGLLGRTWTRNWLLRRKTLMVSMGLNTEISLIASNLKNTH